MSTNDTTDPLEAVRTQLENEIPDDLVVSRVAYEGPELVIYTETPRKFAERDGLIRRLASTLRKRITVRPAAGTQLDPAEAKPKILELIPEEAGITNLQFYPATGEVLIEAEKPGLVIGRRASTLREITQEVGWTPDVLRTPPMESSTVDNVRNFLMQERDDRRDFLERVGTSIHREQTKDTEWVRVTTLGCCREVGRASFVLSTPETRVLIDCGDKPGAEGEVPYLQVPEANPIADLDAVVLTHAHLDHSALLPLLFKYGYDGPVYTTEPTRDLMGLLQLDYLDVAAKEGRTPPYDSEMVREELKHTITLDYGDVTGFRTGLVGDPEGITLVEGDGGPCGLGLVVDRDPLDHRRLESVQSFVSRFDLFGDGRRIVDFRPGCPETAGRHEHETDDAE